MSEISNYLLKSQTQLLSISLGDSICNQDGTFDVKAIQLITEQLGQLCSHGYSIAAVVGPGGAGQSQREYAKHLGEKGREMDLLKMEISKINALVLIAALRAKNIPTHAAPLNSLQEAAEFFLPNSAFPRKKLGVIGVLGVLEPGMTPDRTVAAISRKLRSSILIVSTVEEIYDKAVKALAVRKLYGVAKNHPCEIAAKGLGERLVKL